MKARPVNALAEAEASTTTVPRRHWIMAQRWHDLLFAHWPVAVEQIRALVHPDLEVDTYDGEAWLTIIPFRLSGIRVRRLPPVPIVERFTEINVRTYVAPRDSSAGRPGIFFLSLDTDNPLVTAFARPWFHMPYYNARMDFGLRTGSIDFRSERKGARARFHAEYRPASDPRQAAAGTLEHWLTERYCFYSVDRRGRLFRCDARHAPWLLQEAKAEISENTMTAPCGLQLPATEPLLHYAHHMSALIWPVVPAERPAGNAPALSPRPMLR